MLELAEFTLGFNLDITQGSYNTSVSASGGTHSGGGVVDLRVTDFTETQRNRVLSVLRSIGFVSWYRTPDQGPWGYHIHIVAKGDAELSSAAYNQILAAADGRNGLVSNLYDGLNLNVPTFNYQEWITLLDSIDARLDVLEGRVTATTNARAQAAYASVIEGGAIENRVTVLEGRVSYNTDARAQYAYDSVTSGAVAQSLTGIVSRLDKLDAAVTSLRTADAGINAALSSLNANDQDVASALVNLRADVATLAARLDANDAADATLKTEVDALPKA